jgi:hypothetical protein
MKVKVNIDSVVLNGFSKNDGAEFTQSFKQELSRLTLEGSVDKFSPSVFEHGYTVRITQGMKPDLVGRKAAQSIYDRTGRKYS